MAQHGPRLLTYVIVFAVLLLLLAVTVAVAEIEGGWINIVTAITVATVKAALIMLFFMHLRYSRRVTQVFAVAALLWLLILIAVTLSDYRTRDWPAFTDSESGVGWTESFLPPFHR